jgi:flagellar assembly factor FliW
MTSAALAYPMSSTISFTSDILGEITVDRDTVLTFPRGLLGFPECRSFVLLPSERPHVYWLQSFDYGSLALLLVDPFVFFEGYTLDLDATELHAAAPDEVSVLAIVTLPSEPGELPTANLQGPVVIHTRLNQGMQVVLSETSYGIRQPFKL